MTIVRIKPWRLYLGLALALIRTIAWAQNSSPPPAVAPSPSIPLQQVLIGGSEASARSMQRVPGGGFVVVAPEVSPIDSAELNKLLVEGKDRTLDERLVLAIAKVVESVARNQNYPNATASVPSQDIGDGAVRIALTLGERAASSPLPTEPASPAQAPILRQILIADSVEAAQSLKYTPGAGFLVLAPSLSFLKVDALKKRLADGENREVNDRLLIAIARVVEATVREQELPLATAVIPPQSIADGAVRVAVLPAKFREIKFKGNRWFSESLLRDKLHVEQGEIIRISELDSAVNWTNNNPFRRVRVHIDPIPNTGEANLIVGVQERLPLRLLASVDNSGNDVIGRNRYTAAASYANLWGLDHQGSYQFLTTSKPEYLQAHGIDYRVPLPWRHHLQFSASYLMAEPIFSNNDLRNEAETLTADLRYTLPLRIGVNSAEAFAALTFKQSNNNLLFDPLGDNFRVFGSKTDIFQLTLGASMVRRDKRGAWALSASVTASPGGINSRNTDEAFDGLRHGREDSARLGATASYLYGSISLQRLVTLAPGWDLVSRAVAQASSANLLSSEQLSIGGSSTVRGFNESVFAGDHGFVFSSELLGPPIKKPLPYLSKSRPLEARFLAFFDTGDVFARHKLIRETKRAALTSAGVGVRMSVATNFSLTADYGWQLSDLPYAVENHSRSHIKATLAF